MSGLNKGPVDRSPEFNEATARPPFPVWDTSKKWQETKQQPLPNGNIHLVSTEEVEARDPSFQPRTPEPDEIMD